jgi:hypothetical protein
MLQIRKSSSSAPVHILRLDLVLYRLARTGSAASALHSGRCAVTVGLQFPLIGEGAMLTCRAVASARTVAANAMALCGVSIPAQHVSGQPMLCLGRAHATYPHLMRYLGWLPAKGWLPPDTWQSWSSGHFPRGTWRHRTSSPMGREVWAALVGAGAQVPWRSGFHT